MATSREIDDFERTEEVAPAAKMLEAQADGLRNPEGVSQIDGERPLTVAAQRST